MKERENIKPKEGIRDQKQGISDECSAILPSYDALRQMAHRAKDDPYEDLPKPTQISEVEIPERFRYIGDDLFLQLDSGKDDENRILVFYKDKSITLLEDNRNWYADGTFDVSNINV